MTGNKRLKRNDESSTKEKRQELVRYCARSLIFSRTGARRADDTKSRELLTREKTQQMIAKK
jgi:hypothetical protein